MKFEDSYIPEPNSGCWLWTRAIVRKGYGTVAGDGKLIHAHRWSWILHKGEIPHGMCVCHRCDTPACVNPDHLFLGTNQDNMDDREKKNRQAKGVRHGLSKLNPEKVRQIRTLHPALNHRELADNFGVSITSIRSIFTGRTWSHVV